MFCKKVFKIWIVFLKIKMVFISDIVRIILIIDSFLMFLFMFVIIDIVVVMVMIVMVFICIMILMGILLER